MRSGREARTSVGWYSTARWFANHSSVRRSLHSAYETSRFDASAHHFTVGTHDGVYFGTFFCMNASWPRWTRITDNGRSSSSGRIRSRTPSRYSTRSRLVAFAPSNSGWSRLVRDTPSRDSPSRLPAIPPLLTVRPAPVPLWPLSVHRMADLMDLRLGEQAVHDGSIGPLRAELDAGSRKAARGGRRSGGVVLRRATRVRKLEVAVEAAGPVGVERQRRGAGGRTAAERDEPIAGGAELEVPGEGGPVALRQIGRVHARRPFPRGEAEVALVVQGDTAVASEHGSAPCPVRGVDRSRRVAERERRARIYIRATRVDAIGKHQLRRGAVEERQRHDDPDAVGEGVAMEALPEPVRTPILERRVAPTRRQALDQREGADGVTADAPAAAVRDHNAERPDLFERFSGEIHQPEVDFGAAAVHPDPVHASTSNLIDRGSDRPAVLDVPESVLERPRPVEGEREHPPNLDGRVRAASRRVG